MTTKRCNICSGVFPATPEYFSFYTNRCGGRERTALRGTCKKCMAARTAQHKKDRPDLVASNAERRRSLLQAAEGSYTEEDIQAIRKALIDRCYYCGIELKGAGDIDHMTSLSKGGTNWPSNLTLACKTCNLDKHGKDAKSFFEWRIKRNLAVRQESLRKLIGGK
jgi:5-methylcytosine-specific restriction endonuclease McrA